MFIVTAKVSPKRIAAGALAVALLCGVVYTGSVVLQGREQTASAVAAQSGERKGIKSKEDRIAYLAEFGWAVAEDPVETMELQFPDSFEDDIYQDFLAIQTEQGFDPAQYAGKRVKRYAYTITNYPTGEEGVVADLYIYRNTVIAGEVLSPKLDGFLHGLAMPS